jgi:hypothetical protein
MPPGFTVALLGGEDPYVEGKLGSADFGMTPVCPAIPPGDMLFKKPGNYSRL